MIYLKIRSFRGFLPTRPRNPFYRSIPAAVFLLMLQCSAAFAASDKGIDPADLPTVEAPPPLEIYWKERGDVILLDTVCFNYPDETKKYRGCRKLAAQRFETECERNTRLYHDSRPYYDEDYERLMEKYCTAAEQFSP